jgi:hypothetical protein
VILAVECAFLALVWRLAVRYAPEGGMLALDALAAPGTEARIGVRLDRENPFFPGHALSGAPVVFEAAAPGSPSGWTHAGTAISGAGGVASLAVPVPGTPGLHAYRAGIDPASGVPAAGMEAEVILDVEPLDRALVLVALPPVPGADPLFARAGGGAEPSGRSAAATALRELAAGRAIIYIAPGTEGARAFRPWLEREGFPRGPILIAPPEARDSPVSAVLAGLEASRPRAKSWGVALTSIDAAAFALAGLRAVLLRGARDRTGGSLIVPAPDWPEAVRIIKG